MNYEITIAQRSQPALANAKLGDTFEIHATGIVTGMTQELIDVTSLGQPPASQYVPGETHIEILLTKIDLEG